MFVYVRLRSFTSAPPPVCCVHKHSPFTNVRLRSFTCSGRCEQGTWGCSKTPVWERMTWVVFKNTGFGDVHVEIITLELNHLNVVTVQLLQCLCMLLFTLSLPVTSSNAGRGQLCLKSCSFTPLLLYLEHVAPSLIPPPLCLGPPLSWGGSWGWWHTPPSVPPLCGAVWEAEPWLSDCRTLSDTSLSDDCRR